MRWMITLIGLGLLLSAASALAELKQLPSFTLTGLDGKRVKSQELLGDAPVLFNFWATWCKPCLAEQPKLKAFHEKWAKQGFRVVSVSVDDPRTQKQIAPFVKRHHIDFPVYLDPNQEAIQRLGGRGVPFNVLVGSDGKILSVCLGYRDEFAESWAELIAADLARGAVSTDEEPPQKGEDQLE